MRAKHRNLVNLNEQATAIRNGDLLLFRGHGLVSRLIATAGRSCYTHAARAVWWGDTLFCYEVRELKGGRAVTLESQVRRFPGMIDLGSGPEIVGWVYVRTELPVHIQPMEMVVDTAAAPFEADLNHNIILSESIPLEPGDRFIAENGAIFLLQSYEQTDRIDVLPIAKVQLQ